jgi:hypothetical protein
VIYNSTAPAEIIFRLREMSVVLLTNKQEQLGFCLCAGNKCEADKLPFNRGNRR